MVKTFECPSCGVHLQPDGSKASIICDYCGATVIVPAELRETAAAPNISISIGGTEAVFSRVDVPTAKMREIVALLRANQKIQAVKEYREVTGLGLKESKDAVDAVERLLRASGAETAMEFATIFNQAAREAVNQPARQPSSTTTTQMPRGALTMLSLIVLLAIGGAIVAVIITAVGSIAGALAASRQIEEQITASKTLQVAIPSFEIPTPAPSPTAVPTPGYAEMVQSFGSEGIGAGQFQDARSITVDQDGRIYVGEYTGGRVQVFDADGKFLTVINIDAKMPLLGLEADRRGGLYVSQAGIITRYDIATGKALEQVGASLGRGFSSITLTQSGKIVAAYRAAAHPDDIVILDTDGSVVQTISGAFSAQTGSPDLDYTLAVDGFGNIYALGAFTNEVFKFSPAGRFLTRWGSRGEGKGQFRSVEDIAVDGQGRVYVCEVNRIQVFDNSGRLLGEIEWQNAPMFGITVSDQDEILIAARTKVHRFKVND